MCQWKRTQTHYLRCVSLSLMGFSHLDFPHWTRVILPALTRTVRASTWKTLSPSPESIHPYSTPSTSCSSRITPYIQQLYGLISRAKGFKPVKKAYICFHSFDTSSCTIAPRSTIRFLLGVRGHGSTRTIELMAQLCKDLLPLFTHVERLKILGNLSITSASPGNDTERTHWLELFRSFPAVLSLFVSRNESLLCCKGPPSLRKHPKTCYLRYVTLS
jgi:hypothetical protein